MIKAAGQTFNDGVVRIYKTVNDADNGDEPITGLTLKRVLRYKERTVGVNRYYQALQANARVDYLLRCQRNRDISTQDIAIPNDGQSYRITKIEYPENVTPPCMDITLKETTQKYQITGV